MAAPDEPKDQIDDGGIQPPPEPLPALYREDEFDDEDDVLADAPIKLPAENRPLGIWSHWGGLFTGPIVPFIFYVIEKDKRSLVAWHAREALNFQLSLTIYYLLTMPLMCLFFIDFWFLIAGAGITVVLALFETAAIIFGSLAASRGERYRYPLTIPFVPRPSEEPNPYVDRE